MIRALARPLVSPLARAVTAGAPTWTPLALLRAGEQGIWLDPNDLSTLYQDSAGTIPVTAAGQPVGRMLDKSRGLVLGAEKFSDTAVLFSGGASRVSPGIYRIYSADGTFSTVVQPNAATIGKTYRVEYTVDTVTLAGVGIVVDWAGAAGHTTPGTKVQYLTATSTSFSVKRAGTACDVQISGVSVRELPGNHANQSTTAQRPPLRDTPRRIDYDAVDDSLGITFPSSLGSNCTVARSIPGVGAQILTAQTIGTSFVDNTDNCSLIIVNRALTAAEAANLTRYLNQRAGV